MTYYLAYLQINILICIKLKNYSNLLVMCFLQKVI